MATEAAKTPTPKAAAPAPKKDVKPQPKSAAKPATKVAAPAAKAPEKGKVYGLTGGKYRLGSPDFFKKFPELKGLMDRLEKAGYMNMRFEITCAPKTSPSKKIVNVTKHNAPSDWLK